MEENWFNLDIYFSEIIYFINVFIIRHQFVYKNVKKRQNECIITGTVILVYLDQGRYLGP